MSKERIGVILDIDAQISKAEGSITNLKKSFEGIGGTKGNRLKDLLLDIGEQYDKLSDQSGKAMQKIGDFTKANKASDSFDSALKKVEKEIRHIGQLSDKELKKLFPPEIADRVNKTNAAINAYNNIIKNSEKSKGAIGQATTAYQKQLEVVEQLQKELQELEDAKQKGVAVKAAVRDTQRKSVQSAEKKYNDKIAEAEKLRADRDNYAIQKKLASPNKSTVYVEKDKAYQAALEAAEKLRQEYEEAQAVLSKMYVPKTVDKELNDIKTRLEEAKKTAVDFGKNLDSVKATEIGKALDEAKKKLEGLSGIDLSKITKIEDLDNLLESFTNQGVEGLKKALTAAGIEIKKLDSANEDIQGTIRDTTTEFERQNRAMEDVQGIKNRILQFFSLTNAMQLARRGIQQTFETVKELDKAMTETAVVTDFSVGDMWDELPRYTETAKELGATTLGAYETMTLFYQQGLDTNEVFEIGTETMKMARIAGLEYADATNLMTAALRGFNMELNETSATRINDVYSELAAITAADTNEIATAMTKTASIANSANMEFETTAALLSQIIETTREPAETAGTAMKTIIARFTEMKKATSEIINVDGEEINVNKVEAALKSAGVELRDLNGEFRDLDDVFLELSSKWNGLDKMTQRYVATMAAGSRQQSRFIAMMQDYDRTIELVDAAYGSAGASQQQFDKTLESLEAKLNRLQDAWNEFLMGLSNSSVIKGVVDLLTGLLEAINKATDGTDGLATFLSRLFTVVATFKIGKGIFDKLFQNISLQMFKGGQQGGQQLSRGVEQGVNQSIGQAIKGLARSFPQKIKSIFTSSKMISTIPIELKWNENGTMGVKQFAKTLSSQLTPEQMTGNLKNIGTVLEASVKTSLAAHGLQDEGAMWANGLGDSFETQMLKKGADIQKVIAEIMAQVQAQVANSKVEIVLDNNGQPKNPEDIVKNQQKDNFLKDIDNNDFQIDDDMIPKTEKIEANIIGIGTALTTAAMASNLVTSALEEAGVVSEGTAKTVDSLSSGLSTAGTMMMALKSASDLFNISAAANPYLIGAAILIGIITTVTSLIGQATEKQKEFNKELLDTAQKDQEQTNKLEDLIAKHKELADAYEATGQGEEELTAAGEELAEALKIEGIEVQNLTEDYKELAKEAQKSLEARYAKNILSHQNAQGAAMGLAATEGRFSAGGAGFYNNGKSYEMHLGEKDSFNELYGLIEEFKGEYGLENITVLQGSLDNNLEITGIQSEEQRYQFGLMMDSIMGKYFTGYLSDNNYSTADSSAYMGYTAWWQNVSDYYDSYGESKNSAIENAEKIITPEIETDYEDKKYDTYESYQADKTALMNKYSEDSRFKNFTPQELTKIVENSLGESSNDAKKYSTIEKKFQKQLTGHNSAEWEKYFNNLSESDVQLAGSLDLTIDDNTLTTDVQKALAEKKYSIALEGDVALGDASSSYAQKLISEEGVSEEDKLAMGSILTQTPGMAYYSSQWENISKQDNATQLEFLANANKVANIEAESNRQALMKKLTTEDLVVTDEERTKYENNQTEKETLKAANEKLDSTIKENQDALNSLKKQQTEAGQEAKDNATEGIIAGAAEIALGFGNMIMGAGVTAGSFGTASPLGIPQMAAGFVGVVDGMQTINENVDPQAAAEAAMEAYESQITDAQNILNQNIAQRDNNQARIDAIEAEQNTISGQMAGANIRLFTQDEINAAIQSEAGGFTQQQIWDRTKEYGQWLDQYSTITTMSQASNFGSATNGGLNTNGLIELANTLGEIDFNNLTDFRNALVTSNLYTDEEKQGYLKDINAEEERRKIIAEMGVEVTDWKDTEGILEQLKDKKEELEEKLRITADGTEIEQVQEQINVLGETIDNIEEIEILVEKTQLEAAVNEMELLAAQMQNLNNATALIDPETFQVDLSAFQQLRQLYPDLLEGHEVLSTGMIKLNQDTVNSVVNGVKQAATASSEGTIAAKKVELEAQKETLQGMLRGEATKEDVKTSTAKTIATLAAQQAQDETDAATAAANNAGEASAHASSEIITNMGSVAAATDALGAKIDALNAALGGKPYAKTAGEAFNKKGIHTNFTPSQTIPTADEIADSYSKNQNWLAEYYKYQQEKGGEALDFASWMNNQEGVSTEDATSAIDLYNDINDAINYTDEQLLDLSETEAAFNQAFSNLGTIGDPDSSKGGGGSGGGSDKDDKINYTNPTLENINEKLENLERRREKGEIDALDYEQEKKGLLGLKQGILQADLDKALANSQYKKYFGYDEATDSILLNETEFNKLNNEKKDAVMEEYNRVKGINDELNEIEDEIGEYAANANTVDAINAALEAIERKYENKDLNAIEYTRERDALLSKKAIILQATLDDELANNAEKRFFYYDEVLDAVLLNEEEFNKLSEDRQEEVRKEYEKIKSINDELNEIEDTLKDMEFRSPEDRQQYQLGEAMNWNAQGDLDSINRKRDELGRYDELIGKLPSEIQGPLTLMTGGMNMLYEAEESQVLRRQEEALRMELESQERNAQFLDNGINDPNEAIYYYDEATKSYKIHEDRFAGLKTQKERDAVMEEIEKMKGYTDAINEVQTQRSGGIFQKPFYLAEKSAKAMQKAFKNTGNTAKDVKDAFNDLEKALGLSETALDKFEGGLTEAIEKSGLKDKEIKGLGLLSDEQFNKLNNSKLGGFMGDNTKAFAQMLLGEGSTNGMDFANTGLGALSEMFGFTGDLMNFDMMGMGLDMLNTGKGMIEQGMQMVEKIIGYITQAVQVVVDAWTNREDYLYNFLQIIEKHLRDYEKLQREQNQIEKGRYASVDDIKENWDAQWKSLQTQLEEQTERLETRQKELERSRWNPFSLISGWDPSTDTLYENRTVKFAWDLFIGFGSMAPMGLGSLFGSLNQLYEDYDKRVQNSYEDRLAAEQAILDIEDQRLELVKAGSEQATEFEQRVMDAMVQKEQEQIEELTRLNDTISEANSKLIETLRSNLEKMRQERENEKTEEELGEKERRLAYLRQDTSGANMMEIKKLEEQLKEGHESYTDKLIDQKISELEDQNDKAAEQRQKQIDLLQGQLDYAEKYGLYWDKIYGMLYTFDENGNAILNPDNFDLDGNIRKNSELDKLLGTFSDRIGMSAWSTVLDAEELDYLGKYYGAFIEYNGVTGDWKNAWALRDPGAADPNYAYPEQEIPDGLWGALYRLEIALKKNSIHNNPDIINRGGRLEESFKNFFGKLFGNEEWANYEYEPTSAAHVQSTFFAGMKEDLDGIKAWFSGGTSNVSRNAKNLSINSGGTQNYGDSNVNNYFNIGSVGESISLDDMANRVANIFKDMFSTGNNVLRNGH